MRGCRSDLVHTTLELTSQVRWYDECRVPSRFIMCLAKGGTVAF